MVMLEEPAAATPPSGWKPVLLTAVLTAAVVLLVTAGVWRALAGPEPHPTSSTAWLGTVTSAPTAANGGTTCVLPLPGEPSGITDGQPWCGVAYPSRGLQLADLTPGVPVRVVTFVTTANDGQDVSGMLVLPASLPDPPSA